MSEMKHKVSSVHATQALATEAARAQLTSSTAADVVKDLASDRSASVDLVLKHIASLESDQKRMGDEIAAQLKAIDSMQKNLQTTRQLLLLSHLSSGESKHFDELMKLASCSKHRLGMLAGMGSILDVFGTSKTCVPNLNRLLAKADGFKSVDDQLLEGRCKALL